MPAEPRLLAEFDSPAALERGIDALAAFARDRLEAYAPHPLPELEKKLGIRRSRIPWLMFAAGSSGGAFAFWLQGYLTASSYPLDVGGRPLWSLPSFIPIAFETSILAAALVGFAAWLFSSDLPALNHPVLAIDGFSSVSVDKFWLSVLLPDTDPAGVSTGKQLQDAGALRVLFVPTEASWSA